MKILCNTLELSEACQNVQRAASTKTAIPAIEGILMIAKDNLLYLKGYDLEMGITTSIPAKVEEEGELVLNAHMFSETLRKLPEDFVNIERYIEEQIFIREFKGQLHRYLNIHNYY